MHTKRGRILAHSRALSALTAIILSFGCSTVIAANSSELEEHLKDTADFTTGTASGILQANQTTPAIRWKTPAAITYGTPLDSSQLDAKSSVAGTFVYSPAAGTVLGAGQQTLSVTFTPADTTDFTTATASVTLQVNKVTPAIVWTHPAAIPYGTALSAAQLDATSSVPGAFVYTPALGAVLPAGLQTLSATFTPTDTADYNTVTAAAQLQVNQAAPTISWAPPAVITYGTALSAAQLNASASVQGTFAYTPAPGTVPSVGTQTLSATFTPADTKNYASATATMPLQVTPAAVQATLQSSSLSVAIGATITDDIAISATGLKTVPTISVDNLPTGVAAKVSGPTASGDYVVTFTPSGSAQAGSYGLEIQVASPINTVTLPLSLQVTNIAVIVTDSVYCPFSERMSTTVGTSVHSFLSGSQSEQPQLLQLSQQEQQIAVTMWNATYPETLPNIWNFSALDNSVQPLLAMGDSSPRIRIFPPSFMLVPATQQFVDPSFSQFSTYAQNLVKYYNAGGFQDSDGYHVSPSSTPVRWWSILNEPNNTGGLSPTEYVALYNAVVPAMQVVDPSLKFVALELADTSGGPEYQYVPAFLNGVTARVDAVSLHFYATGYKSTPDTNVLATVKPFISRASYVIAQLRSTPSLAGVGVWVTENSVNYSGPTSDGSYDQRNWDTFFAAFRPYLFSQLAKVGVAALYQLNFNNPAFGEVDANGQPRLNYWVDYWLARDFPVLTGAQILQTTNSDSGDLEELAVKYPDGSVVVMVANHAVANPSDDDGPGASRTVSVDVSQLANGFSSATQMTIDANTDPLNGPIETAAPLTAQYEVTFGGYGVWTLKLLP